MNGSLVKMSRVESCDPYSYRVCTNKKLQHEIWDSVYMLYVETPVTIGSHPTFEKYYTKS